MLHTQSEEDSSAGRGVGRDFFQVLPENKGNREPPYPPLLITLIAMKPSGRIAMYRKLKNPTYAKMGAHQRTFLEMYYPKHQKSPRVFMVRSLGPKASKYEPVEPEG